MKGITTRNNHIQITIEFDKKRYRKTLQIKPTKSNLKYASRQREAWLHELTLGKVPEAFSTKQFTLIKSLLTRWLEHKEKHVKASTYNDYRKSVVILSKQFGSLNASELTIGNVRDFCRDSNATAKRLNNLISPLRQALQEAVEDEAISRNILTKWSYKKPNANTQPVDPFTAEEQQAIISQLTGQSKNLIQFALWTGMRTSEYIALKWSDIDFVARTIKVQRVMTQAAYDAEYPKTLAGTRTIKLLAPAFVALLDQKQYTYDLGEEIFHNPKKNKAWTGDQQVRKSLWIPAVRKAGVRYRRPYQTRHTYASMMLSSREHPMWVAQQMGHSDWSMIAKRYGKWMPEAEPNAGQKAEAIFGKSYSM